MHTSTQIDKAVALAIVEAIGNKVSVVETIRELGNTMNFRSNDLIVDDLVAAIVPQLRDYFEGLIDYI